MFDFLKILLVEYSGFFMVTLFVCLSALITIAQTVKNSHAHDINITDQQPINPSTLMPMINGVMDAGGNQWTPHLINPTTGHPMMNETTDVSGHAWMT